MGGCASPQLPTHARTHTQVKDGKKPKFKLGTFEPKLGSIIQETTNFPCMSNDVVGEVLRGIRAHFPRFIDGVSELDIRRSQLGLAHSYSRAKVKFNVNKVDNMIIQVRGNLFQSSSRGASRAAYVLAPLAGF